MESKLGTLVLPGDQLCVATKSSDIIIGCGLIQQGDTIVATNAGVLRSDSAKKCFWVDFPQKRYVPASQDLVLGIIKERHKDDYSVDLGCALPGTLGVLSFEGATKKNRPDLDVGDVVYCRVENCGRGMSPELTCMSKKGTADGFGQLSGGLLSKCSVNLSKSLLDPDNFLLNEIGRTIPYEIATGYNGRFWINASTAEQVIMITTAILMSEGLSNDQVKSIIENISS